MVPKVTTGAGLRGALAYDLEARAGEPRGEWIAGTLIGTPREMSRQSAAFRALRPDCRKPVWRCSLSLPPRDGRLTAAQWEALVQDFMIEMNIPKEAAWVAVRHTDRDHDHVHFTVLRTLPDATLWNQEHSARRAIKACQAIELRHQLAQHSRDPPKRKSVEKVEIEISNRKGKPMSKKFIQDAVDEVLKNQPNLGFESLQTELKKFGIDAQAYAPKGRWAGITYEYDGVKWSGSKLGTDYSPAGLIARGVTWVAPTQPATATQPRAESQSVSHGPAPAVAGAPVVGQLHFGLPRIHIDASKSLEPAVQENGGIMPIKTAALWLSAQLINFCADMLEPLIRQFVAGLVKLLLKILSALGFRVNAQAPEPASIEDRCAIEVEAREVNEPDPVPGIEETELALKILQTAREAIVTNDWEPLRVLLSSADRVELDRILAERRPELPAGFADVLDQIKDFESHLSTVNFLTPDEKEQWLTRAWRDPRQLKKIQLELDELGGKSGGGGEGEGLKNEVKKWDVFTARSMAEHDFAEFTRLVESGDSIGIEVLKKSMKFRIDNSYHYKKMIEISRHEYNSREYSNAAAAYAASWWKFGKNENSIEFQTAKAKLLNCQARWIESMNKTIDKLYANGEISADVMKSHQSSIRVISRMLSPENSNLKISPHADPKVLKAPIAFFDGLRHQKMLLDLKCSPDEEYVEEGDDSRERPL